jgi:histidinol-phosphate aminotransferase
VPFAVSQPAQAAALVSLEPDVEAELLARAGEVVVERGRVHAELRRLGYPVVASRANFVWLPLGSSTVAWAEACEKAGVIVRAFADAGARVTVSTADDNDRFLEAAAVARTSASL